MAERHRDYALHVLGVVAALPLILAVIALASVTR